jgi:hypothetical protein
MGYEPLQISGGEPGDGLVVVGDPSPDEPDDRQGLDRRGYAEQNNDSDRRSPHARTPTADAG